ncbi:lariat debranching enzyme [Chelonus insularis]|uniref:lariat debranching enzyme n=1 Tax=Chelonus insularis TaxID=460826 RepID=UPI001589C687|nr:lariat debranching enzyme [Chelonus insularis]
MRIAIEGCAHGELDIIYDSIREVEKNTGQKVDLLLCCGDFQSTRNVGDLNCMAVPDKYKQIRTFHKYYSGEKSAPVLTIFIGGNHEASNYLQELPYGGWVAPNIYYMGYASVVTIGDIRIAGISGIYKEQDLQYGHFETPPYDRSTIRSVYHTRNIEVFRLKQLSGKIDIFLSHDWPCGVTKYGNEEDLIRRKPYFEKDIQTNSLGSPPCMELLRHHYPSYWFSAHLHCKYAALVPKEESDTVTKFLALDKCLPERKFLQILDIPHNHNQSLSLSYDLEWLTILFLTNHLLNVQKSRQHMPTSDAIGRWKYTPTESEKKSVLEKFNNNLKIPLNFKQTAQSFDSKDPLNSRNVTFQINYQTTDFCQKLGIDDPSFLLKILRNEKIEDISPSKRKEPEDEEIEEDEDEEMLSEPSSTISSFQHISSSFCDSTCDDSMTDTSTSISTSPTTPSTGTSDKPVEPTMKKFRRRNFSIYESIM